METWAAPSMGTPLLTAGWGLAYTWRDLAGWTTGMGGATQRARHVGSVLRRPLTRARPEGRQSPWGGFLGLARV